MTTNGNKTLLEHHYELRIAALSDDPSVNYAKRLVTVELMAAEYGWRYMCGRDVIEYRTQDIYRA